MKNNKIIWLTVELITLLLPIPMTAYDSVDRVINVLSVWAVGIKDFDV